jgi:ubiquinone/menaquinone biosynthesis C-methylase UbiE
MFVNDERRIHKAARKTRALWVRLRTALGLRRLRVLSPKEAYRLWSRTYDAQPDNAVIALEQEIFRELLSDDMTTLADKVVLDVGCGTGRHWQRLLACQPRLLQGVDISNEMLARLRVRHPGAAVHLRTGPDLDGFRDASVDVVVSSLMLGYVREVDHELREWTRVLRTGGEVIVTDFHPDALRAGAKRTFTQRGATFEIQNYTHTVERLRELFHSLDLQVVGFGERQFNGVPVVLGFRLRRAQQPLSTGRSA